MSDHERSIRRDVAVVQIRVKTVTIVSCVGIVVMTFSICRSLLLVPWRP